jgi:hypothetical protein
MRWEFLIMEELTNKVKKLVGKMGFKQSTAF